jgi:hypothetical protein
MKQSSIAGALCATGMDHSNNGMRVLGRDSEAVATLWTAASPITTLLEKSPWRFAPQWTGSAGKLGGTTCGRGASAQPPAVPRRGEQGPRQERLPREVPGGLVTQGKETDRDVEGPSRSSVGPIPFQATEESQQQTMTRRMPPEAKVASAQLWL